MKDIIVVIRNPAVACCQILPDRVVNDDNYVLSGRIGQTGNCYVVTGNKRIALIDNELGNEGNCRIT